MAVRVGAETLLFGVPEDTQRRLLAAPQVRPSRITRIFVAAAVPDQLGGLPGDFPEVETLANCCISLQRNNRQLSCDPGRRVSAVPMTARGTALHHSYDRECEAATSQGRCRLRPCY